MTYNDALIDRLAAEYVVGSLHGPARRRFARLVRDRADARFAVWRWERHFNALARSLPPEPPSSRVWQSVQRRVLPKTRREENTGSRWAGSWLALPAALVAGWLAVTFWSPPAPDSIAVFADQDTQTLWVISADYDAQSLKAAAINAPAAAANTTYQLWLLPVEGQPQSLGLLPGPSQSTETLLPESVALDLEQSGQLAISVEPAGGSPTGLPTGPVVYQATLIPI